MKNKLFPVPLVLALFVLSSLFATPAQAVNGRLSAITFVDSNLDRHVYAFARGNNYHLVSNHFDGTTSTWTDHGLPEAAGIGSINNPKAITYVDDSGNRRIYVFVVDDFGALYVFFHKGAGFNWQWAKQDGPYIKPESLSATTFIDDNGVRRIYAFGSRKSNDGAVPHRVVTNFWNGNSWSWADLPTLPSFPEYHTSFTEVTNYIGNDGRRRMDVFSEDGMTQHLLRHTWVEGAWSMTNLNGMAYQHASVVNYTDTSGNRQVHTFVHHPSYRTIWDRHGAVWDEVGIPSQALLGAGVHHGFISAIAYKDGGFPRMHLFAEFDHRLYMGSWVNNSWQPWTNLGRPPSDYDEGIEHPTAITYLDSRGGDQHIWVFVTGAYGRLHVKIWDGTSWQWYDRGSF